MNAQHTVLGKIVRTIGLTMLIFVLVAASAQPGNLASAQPALASTPLIWIDPADLVLKAGQTGATEVKVQDVSSLYGVEFHLQFDPQVVEVAVDGDSITPDLQPVEVGNCFSGSDHFVARSQITNLSANVSQIDFYANLNNPAAPINGACTVGRITWRLKVCPGSTALTFSDTKMSDREGGAIAHAPKGSKIRCPDEDICGKVVLQCRTDYSGTDVYLTEQACPGITINELIPKVPSAKTDAQGNFCVKPYPNRTYQCLTVFKHGYLAGQKSSPLPGNLGTITLLGGDMNEDDIINIFDLAVVATGLREGDPSKGDINGDGKCDIYDLTCTGGNYGAKGPVTVWK